MPVGRSLCVALLCGTAVTACNDGEPRFADLVPDEIRCTDRVPTDVVGADGPSTKQMLSAVAPVDAPVVVQVSGGAGGIGGLIRLRSDRRRPFVFAEDAGEVVRIQPHRMSDVTVGRVLRCSDARSVGMVAGHRRWRLAGDLVISVPGAVVRGSPDDVIEQVALRLAARRAEPIDNRFLSWLAESTADTRAARQRTGQCDLGRYAELLDPVRAESPLAPRRAELRFVLSSRARRATELRIRPVDDGRKATITQRRRENGELVFTVRSVLPESLIPSFVGFRGRGAFRLEC